MMSAGQDNMLSMQSVSHYLLLSFGDLVFLSLLIRFLNGFIIGTFCMDVTSSANYEKMFVITWSSMDSYTWGTKITSTGGNLLY